NREAILDFGLCGRLCPTIYEITGSGKFIRKSKIVNPMSLPIVHHPDYTSPLPPDHRFPMPKFGKVYEYLVRNGIAGLHQFHCPERPPQAWLELAHARDYVEAYSTGTLDARAMRRIGFPWSPALANRTCMAVGGTILAAQLALQHGLACNTAG